MTNTFYKSPKKLETINNRKTIAIKIVGYVALISRKVGIVGTTIYKTAKQAAHRLNIHFEKVRAWKQKKQDKVKSILAVIQDRKDKTENFYKRIGKSFNYVCEIARCYLAMKIARRTAKNMFTQRIRLNLF